MKLLTFILIILFLNSCGDSEKSSQNESEQNVEIQLKVDSILSSHNFKREIVYEPLSLIYNGKPILNPGQKVVTLDSTLSFRYDPNGKFWNKSYLIKDHLSLDDEISINLNEGSINGIFFFSSDQIENQIFDVSGKLLRQENIRRKGFP